MPIHEWWKKVEGERFRLEVTDRERLGVNLQAPQLNDDNEEFWSYSLLRYISPGDTVFHYHKLQRS